MYNAAKYIYFIYEQDGKLIIDDVELVRDIGRYLCVADNGLGRSIGEIFIHGKKSVPFSYYAIL